MAVPGHDVNKERSSAHWFQAGLQINIDMHSQHCATISLVGEPSGGAAIHESDREPSTSIAAAKRTSVEKTRAALLALYACPTDRSAMLTLWLENRPAIQMAMRRHIYALADSLLVERMLSGLASHARFFCNEIDEPKAWIARCANLEARRIALQLTE